MRTMICQIEVFILTSAGAKYPYTPSAVMASAVRPSRLHWASVPVCAHGTTGTRPARR
ncbi:MAG: hypothetical protein HYU76_00275 [Betaproteobacteria bacterium]|nr:hypothetical protein [Betaproteobacteria bacterium]